MAPLNIHLSNCVARGTRLMTVNSIANWRWMFITPILFIITKPLAADPAPGHATGNSHVGLPFTAYRAGIGHTEVSRRPLDGSLRYAPAPPQTAVDWSGFYFGATAGALLEQPSWIAPIQRTLKWIATFYPDISGATGKSALWSLDRSLTSQPPQRTA